MSSMTKSVRRWTLRCALVAGVGALVATDVHRSWAQQIPPQQAPQQLASVDQLKTDAFAALKNGQFEQSNQLLARAASMSQDPQVQQMATWMKQFESQRQVFTTERHKQFEKAVAD